MTHNRKAGHEDTHPDRGSAADTRRRRWRGPAWPVLVIVASVLILGFGGLLLAGVLGARDGLELRSAQQATAVANHLERALQFLANDERTLAQAEFSRVLELAPDHQVALARLKELEEDVADETLPQATEVPTLQPVATRLPSTPQADALDTLFGDASQLLEQGQWEESALRLTQLQTLAPDYRTESVTEMLTQAYFRHGLALVQTDHMEAALRSFDEALAVSPGNLEVQTQRDLAALYTQGIGTWGADWSETIATFMELYSQQPDYRDTALRLADAYVEHGDALARKEQWCEAADSYGSGVGLRDDAELVRLRDETGLLCRTATPTPDPGTPGETPLPGTPDGLVETDPATARPAVGTGQIAFSGFNETTRQGEPWLLSASGGVPALLSTDGDQPAISPGGMQVAFRSLRSDMLGLAVVPVVGGEWQRVTTYVEDGYAAWSPDGDQLLFASDREGDRKWRIYRTWASGQDAAIPLAFGRSPAWSPDGNRIAYQGCNAEGANCGLWVMDTDGEGAEQLTDIPGDTAPAWSPDGGLLAFASQERSGNWDLYLLDPAEGRVTTLASNPANDGSPVWAPTGDRLAFLSDRDGGWAIHVLLTDEEGTAPIRLTEIPGGMDDWLRARISWGP